MKLTKPQAALLDSLMSHHRTHDRKSVSESYKPANSLVALGLAEWQKGMFTTLLVITDAGIAEHERRTNG